jgi:hypothetical protein
MKFKKEELDLLKKYTLEFIEKNQLTLQRSYTSNNIFLIKTKNTDKNIIDYQLEDFLTSNIDFRNETARLLLSYIDQKDVQLGFIFLKNSLKIPKDSYEKKEYISLLIDSYTHNLKYKKNLKQILSLPHILNKCPDIILEYFQRPLLLEDEKKIFIEYYKEHFEKKRLFENNLEYRRIVSLMNKTLKKPLDFIFFEEKEKLTYQIKEGKGIYIQINTEDVMRKYSFIDEEKIIITINTLNQLKDVEDLMVKELIYKVDNNKSFTFLLLSNYGEDFFQKFIDLYFETMLSSNTRNIKTIAEIKEIMKETFIHVQKDLLEETVEKKNETMKFKKI